LNKPHPFKWYVPENARVLIIGTFPPVESRWGYNFFYPNPRNLFWKIMSDIAGKPISTNKETAVDERKKVLDTLRVGVTDMGGVIRRLADNSLDENLELIEHMPILRILDEYPSINRMILTSSSGKVSALAWFKLYLLEKGISHVVPKGPKPLQFSIVYNGRTLEVFVLFSPSPRASNQISYPKLLEMYRRAINLW
jgi:G:T/U-mismatch repair DNA glycosylase